jgi:hypothetical protein
LIKNKGEKILNITVSYRPTAQDWADYRAGLCLTGQGTIVSWFLKNFVFYWIKKHAMEWYALHKDQIFACRMTFSEKSILIETDRYRGNIPKNLFSFFWANDKVLILFTGQQESRFVPRRAFTEQEWNQIEKVYLESE